MGILDSKSRIMDTIVTKEGRRQIGTVEKFNPTFVTFTDTHSFYDKAFFASGSIAEDATERIYFEAFSLPQDNVIFEIDDRGGTLGYQPRPDFLLDGETFYEIQLANVEESSIAVTSNVKLGLLTGSTDFASLALGLATGSVENFKNLRTIGSVPTVSANFNFSLSKNKLTFKVTNEVPFKTHPDNKISDIDSTKPLFYDENLGHLPNFQFLPPITKEGNFYGAYNDLSGESIADFSDLKNRIGGLPKDPLELDEVNFYSEQKIKKNFLESFRTLKKTNAQSEKGFERFSVKFLNTNFSNNLVAEMFEINSKGGSKTLKKLDIVDFGEFIDPDDEDRPRKHVYFVGKVYIDSANIPSFVNLFTLVFD